MVISGIPLALFWKGLVSQADARYNTDCYARFYSGRSLPGNTNKESSTDIARGPLMLLMKDMQRKESHRWVCVWLIERYVELGGKRMRRSTLINLICENVEDLVLLSARG